MTEVEFYDVLDQINRDYRRGLLSMEQQADAVRAVVEVFERESVR